MKKIPFLTNAFALALALATAGCGTGALRQMRTGDDCATGDQGCMMAGLSAPLAVGASLRPSMHTQLRGSGAPSLAMWSVAPDIMTVENDRIVGQREGVSALVISMSDNAAIDFVHVWVKRPDRLQLHRLDEQGADLGDVRDTIELLAGESVRLAPHAYAASQRLLGEGDTKWQVNPPIARVMRDGRPGRRRLVGTRAGNAIVTVTSLGLNSTFNLRIHTEGGLR